MACSVASSHNAAAAVAVVSAPAVKQPLMTKISCIQLDDHDDHDEETKNTPGSPSSSSSSSPSLAPLPPAIKRAALPLPHLPFELWTHILSFLVQGPTLPQLWQTQRSTSRGFRSAVEEAFIHTQLIRMKVELVVVSEQPFLDVWGNYYHGLLTAGLVFSHFAAIDDDQGEEGEGGGLDDDYNDDERRRMRKRVCFVSEDGEGEGEMENSRRKRQGEEEEEGKQGGEEEEEENLVKCALFEWVQPLGEEKGRGKGGKTGGGGGGPGRFYFSIGRAPGIRRGLGDPVVEARRCYLTSSSPPPPSSAATGRDGEKGEEKGSGAGAGPGIRLVVDRKARTASFEWRGLVAAVLAAKPTGSRMCSEFAWRGVRGG